MSFSYAPSSWTRTHVVVLSAHYTRFKKIYIEKTTHCTFKWTFRLPILTLFGLKEIFIKTCPIMKMMSLLYSLKCFVKLLKNKHQPHYIKCISSVWFCLLVAHWIMCNFSWWKMKTYQQLWVVSVSSEGFWAVWCWFDWIHHRGLFWPSCCWWSFPGQGWKRKGDVRPTLHCPEMDYILLVC